MLYIRSTQIMVHFPRAPARTAVTPPDPQLSWRPSRRACSAGPRLQSAAAALQAAEPISGIAYPYPQSPQPENSTFARMPPENAATGASNVPAAPETPDARAAVLSTDATVTAAATTPWPPVISVYDASIRPASSSSSSSHAAVLPAQFIGIDGWTPTGRRLFVPAPGDRHGQRLRKIMDRHNEKEMIRKAKKRAQQASD